MSAGFDLAGRRVFVAGHRGMVGSAIVRRLAREDCVILTAERADLDLRDQRAVDAWFDRYWPDVVFHAAARVGGILANQTRPAEFLYDNLMIAANVIAAAHRADVAKLLFLGSSCLYPRLAPQPIEENALLGGPLEPTNQWYAVAKIAGFKLCQAYREQYSRDFITAMPANLYGPGDNFDPASSHVVPALLRKAHEAKSAGAPTIAMWGSGAPRREFIHVDDMADVCVFVMRHYSAGEPINVGAGHDISIAVLARLICDVVGFKGDIVPDLAKPDGVPGKLMSSAKLAALGWQPGIGLREGLERTYAWYRANLGRLRE